jgi:transposase
MPRLMLTDEYWSKLRNIMLEYGIYDKPNLRKTVEGVLYRMRTGLPWRDLPSYFGVWISVYQQFNRWSSKNKLMAIFKSLVQQPDLEWEFIDGSIVKAHQHSIGAATIDNEAIGKSVAGNTTKIYMAADSYGLPINFIITGGEVHDCKVAPEFIAQLPAADYTVADKGYDSEDLRQIIRENSLIPVIPRKNNSTIGNSDMDWGIYRYRHLVENIFARN